MKVQKKWDSLIVVKDELVSEINEVLMSFRLSSYRPLYGNDITGT